MLEALEVEGSVADALYEWMLVLIIPDVSGCFTQQFAEFFIVDSSLDLTSLVSSISEILSTKATSNWRRVIHRTGESRLLDRYEVNHECN